MHFTRIHEEVCVAAVAPLMLLQLKNCVAQSIEETVTCEPKTFSNTLSQYAE